MNKEIQNCIEHLKNGNVILYPTDTVWGIGCDATNEDAVAKIYELKQRAESKSMITLVHNDALLMKHTKDVPQLAWDLIDLSETPTTIIYPEAKNIAKNAIANDGSIGIRMVKNGFAYELLKRFGKPIISTSANISGAPTPSSFSEISNEIKNKVDYIVNLPTEKNKKATPSKIIKLGYDGTINILRG